MIDTNLATLSVRISSDISPHKPPLINAQMRSGLYVVAARPFCSSEFYFRSKSLPLLVLLASVTARERELI